MKLKRVSRLDSTPLNAAYFTKEGYLRDRPIVTTCGIFEYQRDDGSIERELRLPEDVFTQESLKSYRGKPIIFTHEAGEITKEDYDRWRYNYPKYDTTQRWAKVPSKELSDALIKGLKKQRKDK